MLLVSHVLATLFGLQGSWCCLCRPLETCTLARARVQGPKNGDKHRTSQRTPTIAIQCATCLYL